MKAVAILVAIAAVIVALWGLHAYVDGRGYSRGKAEAERAIAEQRNEQLIEAQRRILALEKQVRDTEARGALEQDAIARGLLEDITHAHAETDRLLAAVRRGDVRLLDPGTAIAGCSGGGDGGGTSTAAGAGRSYAAADPGLSREAAEFLLTEADRADTITRQLAAAQAVIVNDRKICNAELRGDS